ncbi:hypothetical protein GH714_008432 [Hevea brasiliensis]|uniref:Uncharacterized protein n=1 Tax=Hevea brasiliensis TaxID=3981 RepID=A0A6A6KYX3_HEVBR|nr:hypothetical protein GH714_008432 [Hevea brasiliensis]
MSVTYISFGTVVNIPPNEIKELAEALQKSRIPFLWSLGENLRGNFSDDFLESTSLHGKAVPWAPEAQPVFAENMINARIIEDIWEAGVRVVGGNLYKEWGNQGLGAHLGT